MLFGAAGAIEQHPNEIFDVDHADDVIQRTGVDRNAGTLGGGEEVHGFFERGGGRERMHVRPGDHQFADLDLVELHGVLHELHFGGLQKAAVAGLFDHHLQFFGGANAVVAGRRGYPEPVDDSVSNGIEEIDGPGEEFEEGVEGAGDDQRDAFGVGQAQRFGNQFAEDYLDGGKQREGQHQGHSVRSQANPHTGKNGCERAEEFGQGDFTYVAESQAGEGDAYLHAGNYPAKVGGELLDHAGAGVSAFRKLPDARLANGDERKFGGGEETVDGDQEEDGEQPKANHSGLILARRGAGGETSGYQVFAT